jgi:RimJ/RimL family protein N-acetyltransferase
MEHQRIRFGDMEVVLRDLEEGDVDTIVSYWYDNTHDYLRSIGVDVRKLTSREEMGRRMRATIGVAQPERAYFVVAEGAKLLAYTNLNFRGPEVAYAHVHVLDQSLRGQGLASQFFGRAFQVFFERFPSLKKVVLETSPENRAVNGLLRKFGLTPVETELEVPDGMARPGKFNVYTFERS